MQAAGTRLRDFYHAELSALRHEAADFACGHPDAAASLGLARGQSSDPQVEMLMQSFAFLAARLQYQVRLDEAALPNALLSFLYPHLAAPLPSMLIAQIKVKADGAAFPKEQLLPRQRYISASAVNDMGNKIECRFRTCYETPLVALEIKEIALQPATGQRDGASRSMLRLRLQSLGAGQLHTNGPERLRFYIDRAEAQAWQVYELLAQHLRGIEVHIPGADGAASVRHCPVDALRWLGFDDEQAMLEANRHTHPAYRLLQEYFTFPEKFMFFELARVDLAGADDGFELRFLFDAPLDKAHRLDSRLLQLNCVPLINLYSQRIDPIALDHTEFEYRLQGDLLNHRYCEIYALEELQSIRPGAGAQPITPYFAMDNFQRMQEQHYFYVARRELSRAAKVSGSELYVSFLDLNFDMALPVDEVVAGRALCTNRQLPEQLMAGAAMYLEGPGPVAAIVALTKPTAHQTPAQIGSRPWALVSQLALNHLSLADGPQALAALKDILRLHVGANKGAGLKQIDAIGALTCRPVMRPVDKDGWRGFVRGSHVQLELDRSQFNDSNPVLFGSVLRHFFTLYANVNSLVELSLKAQDIHQETTQWQPLAGARTVL
jgi:type VI secretion system protein ImpG